MGNIRVAFEAIGGNLTVKQVNDYFPFGMKHVDNTLLNNDNHYLYLYNGKEFIDNLDLDWYDYGFHF